jgi:uncharacterized damage-inducible protein DinB
MNKAKTIQRLKSSGVKTLAAFDWPVATLKRSYGKGKWTARHLLGHLTDCELVFLYRLQFMLSEAEPPVFAFDENAWARRSDYPKRNLKSMKARFKALREAFIEYATTCSAADFARKGKRPDNPDYTIGYLVEHAAEHTEHHHEQVDAIRKGRTWSPAPVL